MDFCGQKLDLFLRLFYFGQKFRIKFDFFGTWLIWCDFRVREISRRREKWKNKRCQMRKIANLYKNFPNICEK